MLLFEDVFILCVYWRLFFNFSDAAAYLKESGTYHTDVREGNSYKGHGTVRAHFHS